MQLKHCCVAGAFVPFVTPALYDTFYFFLAYTVSFIVFLWLSGHSCLFCHNQWSQCMRLLRGNSVATRIIRMALARGIRSFDLVPSPPAHAFPLLLSVIGA